MQAFGDRAFGVHAAQLYPQQGPPEALSSVHLFPNDVSILNLAVSTRERPIKTVRGAGEVWRGLFHLLTEKCGELGKQPIVLLACALPSARRIYSSRSTLPLTIPERVPLSYKSNPLVTW